jgi:hypothetical protein
MRFVADRQPAGINDIPIYPGASLIEHNYTSGDVPFDLSDCPATAFLSVDSAEAVQGFYKHALLDTNDMLKNGWMGDGLFYPQTESVDYYRKAGGIMQRMEIATSSSDGKTRTTIHLCDLD